MADNKETAFISCMRQSLRAAGFGDTRIAELSGRANNFKNRYQKLGDDPVTAEMKAQIDLENELKDVRDKRRIDAFTTAKTLAAANEHIEANIPVIKQEMSKYITENGSGYAPILSSFFDHVQGLKAVVQPLSAAEKATFQRIFRKADGLTVHMGKGFLGTQRGVQHADNVVQEIMHGFGTSGDKVAELIARSCAEMDKECVRAAREAGSTEGVIKGYLPQNFSKAHMLVDGRDAFFEKAEKNIDWERTIHDDGSYIEPEDRRQFLDDVWHTYVTDGDSKGPKGLGGGKGANISGGNQRKIFYKNADAWLDMYKTYGSGTLLDQITSHYSERARTIALMKTFGPNPQAMYDTIRKIVLQKATEDITENPNIHRVTKAAMDNWYGADSIAKATFSPPASNGFNPIGTVASAIGSTLRGIQLGSTVLVAVPGDILKACLTAGLDGKGASGVIRGAAGYFEALKSKVGNTVRAAKGEDPVPMILTRNGYVMEDVLGGAERQQERFLGPMLDNAPNLADKFAEKMWRLSFAHWHDNAMRAAPLREIMGFFSDNAKAAFEELPPAWQEILDDYNIKPSEWDDFRNNVSPLQVNGNPLYLDPGKLLDTKLKNRQELFDKFSALVHCEAYRVFPDGPDAPTRAIMSRLRGNGLIGAITKSMAMYKAFPLTMAMKLSREAIARSKTPQGRIGLMAAQATTLAVAGAMAIYGTNLTSGKVLPDFNLKFVIRSYLKGGGLGPLGDLFAEGVEDGASGLQKFFGGPILTTAGEGIHAVSQWAKLAAAQVMPDNEIAKTGNHPTNIGDALHSTLNFAHSITPGRSLWWAKVAVERLIWDNIMALCDPKSQSTFKRQKQTAEKAGEPYYVAPGSLTMFNR